MLHHVIKQQDDTISALTERVQAADHEMAELKEDHNLLVRAVRHFKDINVDLQEQLNTQVSFFETLTASNSKLAEENALLRQCLYNLPIDRKDAYVELLEAQTTCKQLKRTVKRKRDEVSSLQDELKGVHDELKAATKRSLKLVQQRDEAVRESEMYKRYAKLTAVETGSFIHSGRLLQSAKDTVGKTKTLIHILDNEVNSQ